MQIHVDNLRFVGYSQEQVDTAAATFLKNCEAVHATVKEEDSSEFLGVRYSLSEVFKCFQAQLSGKTLHKIIESKKILSQQAIAYIDMMEVVSRCIILKWYRRRMSTFQEFVPQRNDTDLELHHPDVAEMV